MNINILMLVVGVAALSSCSTAYQTGQTPDDIYYSAPKETIARGGGGGEYLSANNDRERYSPDQDEMDNDEYDTYRNDRWLRMSIGSPYRLSTFNNYYWNDWSYSGLYGGYGLSNYYGYNGLGFGSGLGFGFGSAWNDPWGGSIYWNSFYNPYAFNYNPYGYYYGGGGIGNGKPIYTTPRTNTARPGVFNSRSYNNTNSNVNTNRTYYNPRTGSYSNYNNTNSGNRVITNTNTRRNNSDTYYNTRQNNTRQNTPAPQTNYSRPDRSYTPAVSSPAPSRSSGGGGGGGGRVSRPSRF